MDEEEDEEKKKEGIKEEELGEEQREGSCDVGVDAGVVISVGPHSRQNLATTVACEDTIIPLNIVINDELVFINTWAQKHLYINISDA